MQISVQYSSELIVAMALFLATLLLVRYTWNRVKQLPEEERRLGRPLWIASLSVFLLGLTSLLNYGYALGNTDLETAYYIAAVLGGGLLTIAAADIMGGRSAYALPAIMLGAIIPFAVFQSEVAVLFGDATGAFVAVMAGILFGVPFVLFSYLTYKTRRVTSFGLAALAVTYPMLLVTTSFTAPEIVAVALAIRLYGPALLITALVLPRMGIRAELIAYTFTVSSAFYFLSYLSVTALTLDVLTVVSVSLVAIASILAIGTSAYILSRWRVSRNTATLTLGLYFFVGGFSFLTVALSHVQFITGINVDYTALLISLVATALLHVSAIIALDWRRILLLPVIISIAPFWVIVDGLLRQVPPDSVSMIAMTMAISGLLNSAVPTFLYGTLWWRMRKASAPGRSRALFLTLGVLLLIFSTAGGNLVTVISSILLFSAYSVWWLGVTGRADNLLGTTV